MVGGRQRACRRLAPLLHRSAELSGTDAIVQNLHLGFVTDDECELFATSATDPSEPISRGFVHAVRGK